MFTGCQSYLYLTTLILINFSVYYYFVLNNKHPKLYVFSKISRELFAPLGPSLRASLFHVESPPHKTYGSINVRKIAYKKIRWSKVEKNPHTHLFSMKSPETNAGPTFLSFGAGILIKKKKKWTGNLILIIFRKPGIKSIQTYSIGS